MFYLVRPDRTVGQFPVPLSLASSEQYGINLDNIPWEPSERRCDDDLLRVALRRGVLSSGGLVIEGADVAVLDWPKEVAAANRAARASKALLVPQEKLLEALLPGSVAEGKRLDALINEQSKKQVLELQGDIDEMLSEPIKEANAQGWKLLGGRLPSQA